MSGLGDIPIRIDSGYADPEGPSAMVDALARELEQALTRYLDQAENQLIDLRGLPLTRADFEALQTLLGTGEVRATLEVSGPSEVWETAYAGVWWIRHRTSADNIVAEYLEVGAIPAILKSHPDDMRVAAERLGTHLNEANLSVTTRN
ncbi:MAG: hydrogenase expression/formation C-terminal domain-containing protein [Thiotrichales bacterium]